MKHRFLVLLVFLLALIIRLYRVSSVPPSVNWDEAAIGYNAYSLLETGADEWGERLPLLFRSFGDYKLPLYIYITVPLVKIFGLTSFAVRLPSILSGLGIVILTYLLSIKLFSAREDKEKIGLLAALFVSIEPWTFFISRAGFEANLSQLFVLSCIYFLLKSFDSARYLPLAGLTAGLAVWSYHAARLFLPLFFLALALIYRADIFIAVKKRIIAVILSCLIIFSFFYPMGRQVIGGAGRARLKQESILNKDALDQIKSLRLNSKLPEATIRIIYNPVTFFLGTLAQNWIKHFTPDFLLLKGGGYRHLRFPAFGLLFPINIVFFILGLFELSRQNSKTKALLFSWLLLALLPSSITRNSPNILRATTLIPLPMMLTGLGILAFWKWWKQNYANFIIDKIGKATIFLALVLVVYSILFFLQSLLNPVQYFVIFAGGLTTLLLAKKFSLTVKKYDMARLIKFFPFGLYFFLLGLSWIFYLRTYFYTYRMYYSHYWQYGHQEVVDYIKKHYKQYDKIVMTSRYREPFEFVLYYWPWPPKRRQNDPNLLTKTDKKTGWVDIIQMDKIYFADIEGTAFAKKGYLSLNTKKKIKLDNALLVTVPTNRSGYNGQKWKFLKTIYFLDGSPAFDIFSSNI